MKRLTRAVLLVGVAVLAAAAGMLVRVSALDVEVPPDWRAGPLAVYLLSFPGDGSTLSGRVSVSLAVWNANPEDTIRILLDGEVAAEIDHEGVFTYSWKLRDSHHLAVVSDYAIFAESTFWVKPPPPAPPMIPVAEFLEKLEKQRERIVLYMVMATAAGVPAGIWTKKKTKIRSEWALTLPGVAMAVGFWRLDTLYMLLPLGVAWALTYYLARDYASYITVSVLTHGRQTVRRLPRDDDGNLILGVSPRYWRTGFVKKLKLVIANDKVPSKLEFEGEDYPNVYVNGEEHPEEMKRTDEEVRVEADDALTLAFVYRDLFKKNVRELSQARIKLKLVDEAMPSVITARIHDIWRTIRESELDKAVSLSEIRERVKRAADKLTDAFNLKEGEAEPGVEE